MLEENKNVARRAIEAFDRHDLDALDDVVAEELVWHGGSFREIEGRDAFKQLVAAFYEAFPDLRIELNELIAERDLVAARWRTTSTHKGDVLDVAATGRQASWGEQPIYRIADGKIVEAWWVGEVFGLMQQLGALPSGEGAEARVLPVKEGAKTPLLEALVALQSGACPAKSASETRATRTIEGGDMLGEAQVLVNLSAPDLEEAAAFYQEKLGLPLELRHEVVPGHEELRFTTSGATLCITQGEPPQAQTKELVSFRVDDVEAAVRDLRDRGITFEEYDLPSLKTVDGIASLGGYRAAWFKDPGGNLFGVFEEA